MNVLSRVSCLSTSREGTVPQAYARQVLHLDRVAAAAGFAGKGAKPVAAVVLPDESVWDGHSAVVPPAAATLQANNAASGRDRDEVVITRVVLWSNFDGIGVRRSCGKKIAAAATQRLAHKASTVL